MWLAAGSALLLLAAAVAAHAQLDSAVPVTSPVQDDRSIHCTLLLFLFFIFVGIIKRVIFLVKDILEHYQFHFVKLLSLNCLNCCTIGYVVMFRFSEFRGGPHWTRSVASALLRTWIAFSRLPQRQRYVITNCPFYGTLGKL